MNDRDPGLGCFPKEDQPTFRINAVESISRSNGVSGHSTNGRAVILVDTRVVLSCTGVQKVVAIDGIQQVDPTVLPEPGVQSHTKQTMVPPSAHLIRDVQDGLRSPACHRSRPPRFFPSVPKGTRVRSSQRSPPPTGPNRWPPLARRTLEEAGLKALQLRHGHRPNSPKGSKLRLRWWTPVSIGGCMFCLLRVTTRYVLFNPEP